MPHAVKYPTFAKTDWLDVRRGFIFACFAPEVVTELIQFTLSSDLVQDVKGLLLTPCKYICMFTWK